jgi:hypothetical protein
VRPHRTFETALLAIGALTGGLAHPAAAVEQLDWCAPMVVRPDQRWWSTNPCEAWWKPDTIAARADYILDGFNVPAPQVLPPDPIACFGPQTQAGSRAYHDDLRARAALLGRSLTIILLGRFDLIDRQIAAAPGFDADFLLDASLPWGQSMDFFGKDLTEPCVCGCEWSPERGPSGTPPGTRLKDLIDASGGPGSYETKVQYGIRPTSGGSADGAPRRFFGSAALSDSRNPAYRAWMIGEVQSALAAGGFDGVQLNHKLHQYAPPSLGYHWGGPRAPDVAAYFTSNDTLWSSPPAGFGYREYVESWAVVAADLVAAGVPYSVELTPQMWDVGTPYDDAATTDLDEAALIRGVGYTASWVFLERGSGVTQAEYDTAKADIEAHGSAVVVEMTGGCGFGGPDNPQTPLPALGTRVAVVPDAAAIGTFTGRSITVTTSGTATGPWNAELWCHCTAQPCGTPDATATGLTTSSWSVSASVCDARWNAALGTYRPRVRITRASSTVESLDTITICAPACSNGRDDDKDGFTDYPADAACAGSSQTYETAQCENGKDDDGDAMVDLADPGCSGTAFGVENPSAGGCGLLGIEAVALAAATRAATRRRRR